MKPLDETDNLELVSVMEAAEMLYVGKNTIYMLLSSGELEGFRVGSGAWKIPVAAIERYIIRRCGRGEVK